MKNIQLILIFILSSLGFSAAAQQTNIINQYGPPTFTGGTVQSPSESFAIYQEAQNANYPSTDLISVYPDPARNSSSVLLAQQALKPVTLYIVNLNGTLMRTYTYDGGTSQLSFDVSDLQDGVYNIQVQEQGKSMQSVKLLKQN